MELKFATAFQPVEIVAYLQAVQFEALVPGIFRCGQEHLSGCNAIVSDEVGWERNLCPAFNVVIELVELVRRVGEELAHAE